MYSHCVHLDPLIPRQPVHGRKGQIWPFCKNHYLKFLVAQNCLKKDLEIYIYIFYFRNLSRNWCQFCSSALVIETFYV